MAVGRTAVRYPDAPRRLDVGVYDDAGLEPVERRTGGAAVNNRIRDVQCQVLARVDLEDRWAQKSEPAGTALNVIEGGEAGGGVTRGASSVCPAGYE